MSTRTTYYNLTKPDADEHVLRTVINQNYDAIDLQMHANAQAATEASENVASAYNSATQYKAGDFCIQQNKFYKANANTTGDFDPTAWDETTIEAEFEKKHTWSLFETITADGTSTRIESILPAGTTAAIMKCHFTTGATASAGFHSVKLTNESGRITISYLNNIIRTDADVYCDASIARDGNFYESEFTTAGNSATSALTKSTRQAAVRISTNFLENIRFDTTGSTPAVNIPSGSTFEIYIRK